MNVKRMQNVEELDLVGGFMYTNVWASLIISAVLLASAALAIDGDMGVGTDPNTNGSEAYPWLIEDLADFDTFADPNNAAVYWFAGVNTKLITDIDLAGRTYNAGVIAPDTDTSLGGFQGPLFRGVFEGGAHTIYNLTITAPGKDYIGLFGIMGREGQIKNLCIFDVALQGDEYVGGLAGNNGGGTISSCYATGAVSGVQRVGGLVGINDCGMILSCYSTCSVIGNTKIGGLVGNNLQTSIENCFAEGDVEGSDRVGGLCGENSGYVTNCKSLSSVTGSSYVGGLVGRNYGVLSSCSASGSIVNELEGHFLGGLCGINNNHIINCYSTGAVTGGDNSGPLGGFCGGNYDSITNSYSIGAVTAGLNSGNIGGFCGGQDVMPYISNSFWDVETSGIGNPGDNYYGATGKTTAQMMTLLTFTAAGWDFLDTDGDARDWMMLREGEDYPRLAWQEVYAGDIAGLYGVDLVDLAEIARNWLEACFGNCEDADVDESGAVDLGDVVIVAGEWLKQ